MNTRFMVWFGVFALLFGTVSAWTQSQTRTRRVSRLLSAAEADAEASSWSPIRSRFRVDSEQPPSASTDGAAAEPGSTLAQGEARSRHSGMRHGKPIRERDRTTDAAVEERDGEIDSANETTDSPIPSLLRSSAADDWDESRQAWEPVRLPSDRRGGGSPPSPVRSRASDDHRAEWPTDAALETKGPRGDAGREAIPAWFGQVDADGDGQIGLHEWRAAGGTVDEFQRMDRNQDGFVTTNEVRYFLAQSATRRDGGGVTIGGTVGRVPTTQPSTATPPAQPAAKATTRPAPPPPNRSSPQPAPSMPLSRAPVPAPTPALTIDTLATTPLPLVDGSNPYWLAREAQNEARVSLGHASVLFLGDSITDLLQSGDGRPVWKTFFAPIGAADFAVAGATTSHVLWQLQTGQVAAVTPDVVVLLIGSNNLGQGQSPAATAAGVEAIIDQINHQLPHARVLLLGLLPRSANAADPIRAGIARVNRSIAKLADGERVRYLDFGAAFLLPDGTLPRAVMPDLLHPNLLGYQIYTAAIWQPLLAMLEGG